MAAGISLKLEDLAAANNISNDDAHDAIADCRLMLELLKLLMAKYLSGLIFLSQLQPNQACKLPLIAKPFSAWRSVSSRTF